MQRLARGYIVRKEIWRQGGRGLARLNRMREHGVQFRKRPAERRVCHEEKCRHEKSGEETRPPNSSRRPNKNDDGKGGSGTESCEEVGAKLGEAPGNVGRPSLKLDITKAVNLAGASRPVMVLEQRKAWGSGVSKVPARSTQPTYGDAPRAADKKKSSSQVSAEKSSCKEAGRDKQPGSKTSDGPPPEEQGSFKQSVLSDPSHALTDSPAIDSSQKQKQPTDVQKGTKSRPEKNRDESAKVIAPTKANEKVHKDTLRPANAPDDKYAKRQLNTNGAVAAARRETSQDEQQADRTKLGGSSLAPSSKTRRKNEKLHLRGASHKMARTTAADFFFMDDDAQDAHNRCCLLLRAPTEYLLAAL